MLVCLFVFRTRGCGRIGARHSLRPLFSGAQGFAEPGQDRAAGTDNRADTGCILREYQLAATTWNSLYGCTDPFMLLATRKAGGLGQSSNRNNNGDEEAN